MKHSILSATATFVLTGSLLLAQQPSSAPHGPEHHGAHGNNTFSQIAPPGMWWKNPNLIQKLAITPDQQKRMDDIFQQSRLKLQDLKAEVDKQNMVLEPMLNANPPDTNKVIAQINHVAQSRAALEEGVARMLLGIRTVLTPDQWTKLQTEQKDEPRTRQWQGKRGSGQPGTGGRSPNSGQQPPA